jgi:DNA adenine methylase
LRHRAIAALQLVHWKNRLWALTKPEAANSLSSGLYRVSVDDMSENAASVKQRVSNGLAFGDHFGDSLPGVLGIEETRSASKNGHFSGRGNTQTSFSSGVEPRVKPFIKWAGGKVQILPEIRALYPKGLGKTFTKYAEPFVGGGAVLFDVLSNYELSEVFISDINRELVVTYKSIRDRIDDLVAVLTKYQREYVPADHEKRQSYFYARRERFNELKALKSDDVEVAGLFIFLNRTCFNGLYRVNRKGEYNVPMGSYKKPTICDADNLYAVSNKLANVDIVWGDYKLSRDFIDERTFVYFDPPYRPLSQTSNFTAYAQDGFSDEKQAELARFIDEMSAKGARIVASNADPKNTDQNDDFFDRLYHRHKIHRITATRLINSDADGRGKINELLIANY